MTIQKEINFEPACDGGISMRVLGNLPASAFNLATSIQSLWRAFQQRNLLRRDMKRLEGLPDYLLRDIGLRRDDLGSWRRHNQRTER